MPRGGFQAYLAGWVGLLALPTVFLAPPAMAVDRGEWKIACEVPDMELAGLRRGVRITADTALASEAQAWLRHGMRYAVLTMPGCKTRDVLMPDTAAPIDVNFVSAGGYLLRSWDNKTQLTSWWVGNDSLRPMPRPPSGAASVAPVLSADGNWVAWLERVPGERRRRVVIRSLNDDREQVVAIPDLSLSSLLDLDMRREELTLYQYDYLHSRPPRSSLVVLSLDGARRGEPLVAEGVEPQASTFLRAGSGWVAWDATREGAFEPYRISWSVSGGRGSQSTTAGRSITAVAVNPAGTYIAVSETNSTRIHIFRDAVYILRTSDAQKVWSRSLPMFARSSLAFLGDGLFAYTEVAGTRPTVRVLEVP